jgi:Immunity protein family (Imm11)
MEQSTSKKRKFYFVTTGRGTKGPGFRLANRSELFRERPRIFVPPPGRRGFRKYDETPIFLADSRLGRINRDFEIDTGYWFISDRMKAVIESVDREAFAFLKCKVQMRDGSDGPVRWLCDVIRVLDALDEENSDVEIGVADNGSKTYNAKLRGDMTFKPSAIGSHHVFRMAYYEAATVCDDHFRLACKSAELTGVRFVDRNRR